MCGIALLVGPGAEGRRAALEPMLAAVAPRGEVEETLLTPGALLGTHRLRIVDREHAVQPWRSGDGRWALSYNGEVFNHGELRARLREEGRTLRSESDTEVVLEALLAWGLDALTAFRGELAFGLVDLETGRMLVGRDPAGVKPLYWARDGRERIALASEVKALVHLGGTVHEIPPGHAGWVEPGADPVTAPYLDLSRLGEGLPEITDVDEAAEAVRTTFRDAVRVRVDTDLTVGVVLSGGLDSSLTLTQVHALHPDCVAFTIGSPESPDVAHARLLTADLGVRHEVITVRPREISRAEVREAIRVSEATEHGDVINAVVSMRLFRAVRQAGVKVVLTGDGSDELFGGYDMYRNVAPHDARALFLHKIGHLSRTELQRVDRTSMGNGVEARVPFLDPALLSLAMRLPASLKMRDGYEKWILRHAFADVLPAYIRERHKHPMSHSSGLHERVRLHQPWFASMYRGFGYEALGPMRRDFWRTLRDHDHDLAAAVEAARTPRDLSVAEHARDLASAVRWNLVGAARGLRGR